MYRLTSENSEHTDQASAVDERERSPVKIKSNMQKRASLKQSKTISEHEFT